MLLLLTGDIQIGKTRWLQQLVSDLENSGVTCGGVIAPGVWRQHDKPALHPGMQAVGYFEKFGIENELLPSHQRIPFAIRRDLADPDPNAQSSQAGLGWSIDDSAILQVNQHFADLAIQAAPQRGILIVDELGRLELLRNQGLTEAVALLDAGPSDTWQHAIIVVRESLLHLAQERFSATWDCQAIGPTQQSAELIKSLAR